MEIYDRELNVSPFIVAPVALINKEATFVFGPRRLTRRSNDVIEKLYAFIPQKGWTSPVVCQVVIYQKEALISNTIQTNVPDVDSGRLGLKLTYGASIRMATFHRFRNVCRKTFSFFDRYFLAEFGRPMSVDLANQIVSKFQKRDAAAENLISQEKTNDLLTQVEQGFFFHENLLRGKGTIKSMVERRKFLFRPRRAPMPKLEHARLFWKNLDDSFRTARVDSEPIVRALREVATLRGISASELARTYLEIGFKEDLTQLLQNRFVQIAERVLRDQLCFPEAQLEALLASIRLELETDSD